MLAKNFRVLLVDDDELNRRLFSMQIRDLGYECDTAAGGAQALAALEKSRYQLVFMDCRMPGMDGFEVTRRLREREKSGARRVTIVALTALDSRADRSECLSRGMDDYLIKPFKIEEMAALLSKWDRPLDPSLVRAVREAAGDERFRALAAKFADHTRRDLEALRGFVEAEDAARAKDLLHDLKGKTGMFGAARLEVLVVKIADLVEAGRWDGDLPAFVLRCEAELREYEKTIQAPALA